MTQNVGPVKSIFIKILSLFTATIMALATFAQDKKEVDVNINTDKGGGSFFSQPWVWVVGAAVFIIILVAILRGGGKKE